MGEPPVALGCQDAVGWSRRAPPSRSAWTADKPRRLVEKEAPQAATDRKALACSGLCFPQTDTRLRRLVTGRPVRHVTCDSRAGGADRLAQDGTKA